MDTAAHVLVIFLSVFLAIFLLLGIIVAVQVIRLLSMIQHIAKKAETIIESAESVGTIFKNAAGPLAILKVVGNIVHAVKSNKK
jgi:hypothetical protein